jgi:hypothetical protein
MATRLTHISNINVPVYYSCRCQKCNEVGFNTGMIRYSAQATTKDPTRFNKESTRNRAERLLAGTWKDFVLLFMSYPNQYDPDLLSSLNSDSSKCEKCKRRYSWKGDGRAFFILGIILISLAIPVGLISLILAFLEVTSFVAWLVFAVSVGIIAFAFVFEKHHKNKISKIPIRYLPVFGTEDAEIIEYANKRGIKVLTPEETFAVVSNE